MDAKQMKFCGAGMRRSEAEGRFGEAEPAVMTRPKVASQNEVARGLRSSVCARAPLIGVKSGRLDGVRVGSGSKMGKLQAGATSYLCKVNVIEALARDHESWPGGESRKARFEPSPCRSGFRLRLARRQVAASALRAFAARHDTNAAYAVHEYRATFCHNRRPMHKGLIYPDECCAIH